MHMQLSDVQAWSDLAVTAKAVLSSVYLTPTSEGIAEVMAGWAELGGTCTCPTHEFNQG